MRKNSTNAHHSFGKMIMTVLFVFLVTVAAQAQGSGPGFHVSTRFDNGCAGSQTVSSPTPPASIGPVTVPCVSGSGTAAAEAGAGTLRASSHSAHVCCGSASSVNGRSRIQIENVVITGPAAASIPISLNFHLRGTINSHTDFGQAGITLFMALHGFNTLMMSTSEIFMSPSGILNQTGVFAPMNVTFPNATIDQAVTTATVNAAPNQPLTLEFQMSVFSDMAGLGATQSDFFSGANGFRLPFGTPVFNLPPGYTINIPELNIINNFVALPAVVSGDIFIVGTNASEISLAGVTEVTGNVVIVDNAAATVIDLSTLQTAGGNVVIDENTAATVIDLSSLQTAGGNVVIDDSTAATIIDLGSLQTASGNVVIDDNTAATVINLSALTSAGAVDVTGNTSATGIDLPALTSAGAVDVTGNTSATGIDLPLLTSAGAVDVTGNTLATGIDLPLLTSVDGPVDVTGNTSATGIDLPLLTSAGAVDVTGNTSATGIDLPLLTSAGAVDVTGNTSATGIDLNSLTTANGDVTIADNGPCTNVILAALTNVMGNLIVESCGTGTFTPGPAAPGGNTTLTTTGYTIITGTTANGTTTLSNTTSEASMTAQLPAGSFTTPVSFSLTHLDPATLVPEPGLDANNAPATIDPVAAYQITFGVPTLNQNATLTFDVFLNALDTATADALLAALANGSASLATKGDAESSQYQAFPICSAGQVPTVGGCVLAQLLDGNGQPSTGTPAIVRFSNIVGHFSTWAVAIVTPNAAPTSAFNGLLPPYPKPPHTTVPTFKRGSVVPLKFNWIDAAGVIIDSANANPTVSVSPTNCSQQATLTDTIAMEDAGNSGGLRYDATTMTWVFNWSTKPLAVGCFVVRVTPGSSTFVAPANTFPVALRDQ